MDPCTLGGSLHFDPGGFQLGVAPPGIRLDPVNTSFPGKYISSVLTKSLNGFPTPVGRSFWFDSFGVCELLAT